jgi:hypothetical protein
MSSRSAFYTLLFFAVSLNASWTNLCLTSLPFPVTVGLIYQIGKSDYSSVIRDYLNSKPSDFIGYRADREFPFTIGYNNRTSDLLSMDSRYCYLPLTVFMVGACLNYVSLKIVDSAHDNKNSNTAFLFSLLRGTVLTFAWSLSAPHEVNPFVWKSSNGTYVNEIIKLS